MLQVGDLVRYAGDKKPEYLGDGTEAWGAYRDGRILRVTAATENSVSIQAIAGEGKWNNILTRVFEKV